MVEVKVQFEPINDGETSWDIDLYSNKKFIKTICTCYEEDYAEIVAIAIAKQIGATKS